MAKCHRLGAGSHRFPAISAASLRRRLIEVVACCCSPSLRRLHKSQPPKPIYKRNLRSDCLSELLKMEISDSDSGSSSNDSESESRQKIEGEGAAVGVRRAAAATLRRLAKDDVEARETIAMLRPIMPLIGMIESDDLESQISALYALLNLKIGNDMQVFLVNAFDASRFQISADDSSEVNDDSNSLYNVASKAVGVKVQRAMDPDVAKLLDDGDLSRFGSDVEDLDEDFVVKANLPNGEEEEEVVVEGLAEIREALQFQARL